MSEARERVSGRSRKHEAHPIGDEASKLALETGDG